jgi:hypothetical protein
MHERQRQREATETTKAVLAMLEDNESKSCTLASGVSYPTIKTHAAKHTARKRAGGSSRQRGEVAGKDDVVPPIDGKTRPMSDPATVSPAALYVDEETLHLMSKVKNAHEAVREQTANWVAHILCARATITSTRLVGLSILSFIYNPSSRSILDSIIYL